MTARGSDELTIKWPKLLNEHGYGLLWFASWIVGEDGSEGDWFYSGRGGELQRTRIPPAAIGVRVRRWPSEGFEAEYADVLFGDGTVTEVSPEQLAFDMAQRFSRLSADILAS